VIKQDNGGRSPDKPSKKSVAQPNTPDQPGISETREVGYSLAEAGLFSSTTPVGREPVSYPIAAMDRLDEQLSEQVATAASANPKRAAELQALRRSVKRISMAYQVLVHPVLDVAGERVAKNPTRNPETSGPTENRLAIEELVRDAQQNPAADSDTEPHRGPIVLSDQERESLGQIAATRGLPFNPEKREYRYTELLPRMEARNTLVWERFLAEHGQRMIEDGYLRDRRDITDQIRQRQERWRKKDPKDPDTRPSEEPPSKP
jgi:hypothetical protein